MENVIDIVCNEGIRSRTIIGSVQEQFAALLPEDVSRVIIITDAKVHVNNLAFINAYEHIVIGQGESSKTFVKIEEVYRQLLAMGADRSTFLVGMGGGIVTDITGFVASTYMRGVRFGFLPTTLLAQVDASIGGKNGVNLDGFKNIIGTFNMPAFVLCDPDLLGSLSDRDFRAGLAEAIKTGIIGDPELFALLENHTFEEIRTDKALLREIIVRCIRVKTAIVEHDQREHGERRKLNLGHTFAHAMEKSVSTLSHGEAVAVGLVVVSNAAVRQGLLSAETAERIRRTIERLGLPTESPAEMRQLLTYIRADKKREGDRIYLVYPHAIGSCEVVSTPTESLDEIFIVPAQPRATDTPETTTEA